MHTIKLTIAYDGTNYSGWQLQPKGKTVQGELEHAIKKVFGKHSRVHAASRTDAGVHARAQVVHFRAPKDIPLEKVPLALNSALAEDITVIRAEYVPESFHSRFDAKRKHYSYFILNSYQRDPFEARYSWRVPYELNVKLMQSEAKALIGRHDLKAFQAKDKIERSSVREIFLVNVKKKKNFVIIDIEADGFLYNMVRNVVGTLVDIGRGYLPKGSIKKILASKDRAKAGPTAPANGLFLVEVKY